jgi:hypothetical protein
VRPTHAGHRAPGCERPRRQIAEVVGTVGNDRGTGCTTDIANNTWACGNGSCGPQTLTAHHPGNWFVVSAQASGDTAVLTYPNVQQVFTKTTDTDPAISAFTAITSAFTETMNPQAGTDAEAAYDLWASRGGEVIFSLNKSERSGTVDILGVLTWLRGRGLASSGPQLGQVDFGFEICSTGGKPEKFAVSRYTLTSTCASAGGCFG